jgi:hypothetical protein
VCADFRHDRTKTSLTFLSLFAPLWRRRTSDGVSGVVVVRMTSFRVSRILRSNGTCRNKGDQAENRVPTTTSATTKIRAMDGPKGSRPLSRPSHNSKLQNFTIKKQHNQHPANMQLSLITAWITLLSAIASPANAALRGANTWMKQGSAETQLRLAIPPAIEVMDVVSTAQDSPKNTRRHRH